MNVPTAIDKAASNIWRRYAQYSRDFAISSSTIKERFGFVDIKGNCTSWFSSVHVLLTTCRPVTIAWRVFSIVVNAIKCQALRAFTHIGEKISKIPPLFADCNASSAVVTKPVITRVAASIDHTKPRAVSAASFSISCVSVFGAIIKNGHGNLLSRIAASSDGRTLQGSAVAFSV